jgi:hypothetical protein
MNEINDITRNATRNAINFTIDKSIYDVVRVPVMNATLDITYIGYMISEEMKKE